MLSQIRTTNARPNVLVIAPVHGHAAVVPTKGRKCFRTNEIQTLRAEFAGTRRRTREQAMRLKLAVLETVRLVCSGTYALSNAECLLEFDALLLDIRYCSEFHLSGDWLTRERMRGSVRVAKAS